MEMSGDEKRHDSTLVAEDAFSCFSSTFSPNDALTIRRMFGDVGVHLSDRMFRRVETGDHFRRYIFDEFFDARRRPRTRGSGNLGLRNGHRTPKQACEESPHETEDQDPV